MTPLLADVVDQRDKLYKALKQIADEDKRTADPPFEYPGDIARRVIKELTERYS